jgi:hypothetical protein
MLKSGEAVLSLLDRSSSSSVKGTISTSGFVFLDVHLPPVGIVTMFCVSVIIIITVCKIAFHLLPKNVAGNVPEAFLLLVLGLPIGAVVRAIGFKIPEAEVISEVFFVILLPLIILPDAYYANPVHIFESWVRYSTRLRGFCEIFYVSVMVSLLALP